MRAITAILYLAFSAVVVMGFFTIGPLVETRWFPVYSKFEIMSLSPAPNGTDTLMTVRLYKIRACAPRGFAWFTTDFGNFVRQLNIVSTNRQNPAPQLPVGRANPTFIIRDLLLTETDISSMSGETYSQCHPFWITRTEVFP